MAKRLTIEYERADGKRVTGKLPTELAWTCARACARDRSTYVTLFGDLGVAEFDPFGGGTVTWSDESDEPGVVTRFDKKTSVIIQTLDKMSRTWDPPIMGAKELKKVRTKLGMTQPELANRLKVTWRTVARWEAGAKIPETVRLALKEVLREEGLAA